MVAHPEWIAVAALTSKLSRFFAVAVLLVLLIWAALWALADHLDAKAILILARATDGRATKREVAEAKLRLDTAISLNPFDADFRLHQVYFSRALCRIETVEKSCCDAKQLEAYRMIIRLRPTWGDAWLDYATCLQARGASQMTLDALDKALRFSPVAYGVTRRSVSLGFSLLDGMNPEQRERYRANLRLLLKENPRFVLKKAFESKRSSFVEPLLFNDKQKKLFKIMEAEVLKAGGS